MDKTMHIEPLHGNTIAVALTSLGGNSTLTDPIHSQVRVVFQMQDGSNVTTVEAVLCRDLYKNKIDEERTRP